MKNKIVRRILILAVIAAVAVGGICGGLHYRNTSLTAEVTSVESLDAGYWGDQVNSSGMVTNDYSQVVELTSDMVIKEVFVEEGQEVHAGDKLVELDTTATELNYNIKVLETENLQNQIDIAKNELKTLKNTKPYVPPKESEIDSTVPSGPEKTGNAYNYISDTAVPYNQNQGDGSPQNPWRYLCTEDAYVTGEFLQGLVEGGSCAVFEVHENNEIGGAQILSWTADGNQLIMPDGGTRWSVADRTQVVDEISDTEAGVDPESEGGYTSEELKEMIAQKEQEIAELDLSKRKAQLEVDRLKLQNSGGIIYASVDGTVKNLQDKDQLPGDGTPFLTVAGSEGLYVTGSVSELLLDQVQPGQMVTVNSWESGISCEATIREIGVYPTQNTGYGEGNQNVSYYPYTAYIEDTAGLRNGEYVDLNMTIGGEEGSESIYLFKGYVRTENGQSYVLKADENNRLVKQKVKTGRIIYGDTIEVKSGLTAEDRIAFPYGKTAKEGVRAVNSDDSEM